MAVTDFLQAGVAQAGGTLTEADLVSALEQLEKPQPVHRHVVHPNVLRVGGWTICGDCFAPVHVPEPA